MSPTRSDIYYLKKPQIIALLEKFGLESTGSYNILRQRLLCYFLKHPEHLETLDMDDGQQGGDPPQIVINPPADEANERIDSAKVMNQIRKWGCHFDGRDPLSFLERLDELKQSYGYTGDQMLMGLPEMLKGDSLLWYRNCRSSWVTWDDFCDNFKKQFLPRRFRTQLVREIQGRTQRADEPFQKYATAMLTNMRRAGKFSPEEQLDRLYENMNPEYKLYIRLDDLTSLSDLSDRAAEYEAIEKQRRELRTE